jgi:hypothetical protein
MKGFAVFLAVLSTIAGTALAATFEVEHDHLWGSCKGDLAFTESTVEYKTDKSKHARIWKYEDIQQIEIVPGRISILTYEDRKVELGRDRAFRFKLLSGQLTEAFRKEMESRLARPLVSSVVPEMSHARYTIPVRHRRFLGDSQGVLELADDYIVYRAQKAEDSRVWRYDELLSVGSTGPFQLRLGAVQKTGGEFGDEKHYVFDLKRRLKSEEYDFLWNKINRPQIEK